MQNDDFPKLRQIKENPLFFFKISYKNINDKQQHYKHLNLNKRNK